MLFGDSLLMILAMATVGAPELSIQATVEKYIGSYVAISPDGRFVAQGASTWLSLWDLASGKKARMIVDDSDICGVHFLENGNITTCGDKGESTWDRVTGARVAKDPSKVCYHSSSLRSWLSPDQRLVVIREDHVLSLVDNQTGAKLRVLMEVAPGDIPATDASFTADGKVVATTAVDSTILFSIETGARLKTLRGTTSHISDAVLTKDGRIVFLSTQTDLNFNVVAVHVRTFDLASARQVSDAELDGLKQVLQISLAPAGDVVVGNEGAELVAWDLSGKRLWSHKESYKLMPTSRPVFSADGTRVAVYLDGAYKPMDFDHCVLVTLDARKGSVLASDGPVHCGEAAFPAAGGPGASNLGGTYPLAFDADGRQWIGIGSGEIKISDPRSGSHTMLKGHSEDRRSLRSVKWIERSLDGLRMASSGYGDSVRIWTAATGKEEKVLRAQQEWISMLHFSPDGKRVIATDSFDDSATIWDVERGRLLATLVSVGSSDVVIATPEGYYSASRGGVLGVAFRFGDRAVPFEQLDLRFNRPDKVVEALGFGSKAQIEAYRRAHERRLKKLGIEESALSDSGELPEVSVVPSEKGLATKKRTISLDVEAVDRHRALRQLQVAVNGVPVFGTGGIKLEAAPGERRKQKVDVVLSSGINRIEVSAINDAGQESIRSFFEITCEARPTSTDVYAVVIGVSEYADASYRLQYASKDAEDVARFFEKALPRGKAHVLRILDKRATREGILGARAFLEKAGVDDRVVIFLAGHGMLDENLDYEFGTTDIDFAHPRARGLPYPEIENLLDGLASRQKLLLVDTCNSGEVDKEETALLTPRALPEGRVRARAVRGLKRVSTSTSGRGTSLDYLRELFADVSRGSGAAVISSAGGLEFALESAAWKNGVFTYSLLSGLKSGSADRNKDGRITVSELRDWVTQEVVKLTAGGQTPAARRESLEHDFAVLDKRR